MLIGLIEVWRQNEALYFWQSCLQGAIAQYLVGERDYFRCFLESQGQDLYFGMWNVNDVVGTWRVNRTWNVLIFTCKSMELVFRVVRPWRDVSIWPMRKTDVYRIFLSIYIGPGNQTIKHLYSGKIVKHVLVNLYDPHCPLG